MPHAIQRKAPNVTSVLAIDMNCMIYHVLREPKMLAHKFPAELGAVRVAWERKLQDEVCSYLTHIWRAAGSPLQVYIALDGVVPYAKIKQQRFRRFKSAAAAASPACRNEQHPQQPPTTTTCASTLQRFRPSCGIWAHSSSGIFLRCCEFDIAASCVWNRRRAPDAPPAAPPPPPPLHLSAIWKFGAKSHCGGCHDDGLGSGSAAGGWC